jgi:hypothetical protein
MNHFKSQKQRLPAQERSRVLHHVSRRKKDVFQDTTPAGTTFPESIVLQILLAESAKNHPGLWDQGDRAVTRDRQPA